jgi:ATP-binding cassette subfamily B (MDR/TAP) protein 1
VQPEILFLDEFTSALDEALEGHIIETIQHLRDSTTIVVVTHRRELMRIADSVIVFNQGSIVDEGPYQSISTLLDSFPTTS